MKTVTLTTLEAVDTSKTTTIKNPKTVAKVTGTSPPIMGASDDANMIPLKHNESHTTKFDADSLKKAVETASKKINVYPRILHPYNLKSHKLVMRIKLKV